MAAKPRKSVVQNIIKNLLEMEIPEIQTASKELAEWIKQLEQHSFKLQHYATEIETWASEEEEADSIELTDLIKDLEATLSDMRTTRTLVASTIENVAEKQEKTEKLIRGYGRSGRVLKEPKSLPKAEFKEADESMPVKQGTHSASVAEEPKKELRKEPVRTPQGILVAKDSEKPKAKAELPTGGREPATREAAKTPPDEDETRGYMTPEGFLIRRLRQ